MRIVRFFKGLWRCVEEGKVVQTLEEAAAAEGGHQGSKVYAVEAVWLWQKGVGRLGRLLDGDRV